MVELRRFVLYGAPFVIVEFTFDRASALFR